MFKDIYNWLVVDPEAKSPTRQWLELIFLYLFFAVVVLIQGELPYGWVIVGSIFLLGGIFSSVREFLRIALIAAILVFGFIRPFVVQAFYIPSRSMENTLLINDHIFVNKFIYYFSAPERWDIVVFEYPPDPDKDYIKRLVGRPGDTVAISQHRLILNGETIPRRYVSSEIFLHGFNPERTREIKSGTVRVGGDGLEINGKMVLNGPGTVNPLTLQGEILKVKTEAGNHRIKVAKQTANIKGALPGHRSLPNNDYRDFTSDFGPVHVPRVGEIVDLTSVSGIEFKYYLYLLRQRYPGKIFTQNGAIYREGQQVKKIKISSPLYFVMGDNRDHSEDSRFWGFVPADRMLGEAFFIYWPPPRIGLIGN